MKSWSHLLLYIIFLFLTITVKSEYKTNIAVEYLDRAEYYKEKAQYDSAAHYFELALQKFEQQNNPGGIIQSLNGRAHIALIGGDNELAYDHLSRAIEVGEKHFGEYHPVNARTYDILGRYYLDARQPDKGREYLDIALKIKEEHYGHDHPETAQTYRNIGLVYRYQNQYHDALEYFHKTLDIYLEEFDEQHLRTADIYNDIGVAFDYLGDYYTAHRYYTKVLEIRQQLLEYPHNDIARAYGNLGIIALHRGDYESALKFFSETLAIQIELFGDQHLEIARTYYNLGIIYNNKHDFDTALRYLSLGLQITIDTAGENYFWLPFYYSTIATTYKRKNDLDEAEKYFRKALQINLDSFGEEHRDVYFQQSNLGIVYTIRGEYATALTYFEKALEGNKRVYDKDHPAVAQQYSGIGDAYFGLQQYDRAYEHYDRALYALQARFGDHHPSIAEIHQKIGDIYIEERNFDKALHFYQSALYAIAPGFTDPSLTANPHFELILSDVECANILKAKAQAFELRGDLHYALNTYVHLTDLIEKMRINYLDEGSKLFLASKSFEIYERATGNALLLYEKTGDNDYIELAFTFSERSKAGTLREALNESDARHFAGIPEELLEREREIRTDLAYYELELQKEELDDLTLSQFRTRYYTLRNEYTRLLDTFERKYPEYYNLKYSTDVLTIDEIQASLDDGTALLEYLAGQEYLYLVVITSGDIAAYRKQIDDTFKSSINAYRRALRLFETDKLLDLSFALYSTLLKPAANLLANNHRLIIIPDGVLHYVPFETLITERYDYETVKFHKPEYLIRDYEIQYHYSASLYAQGGFKQAGVSNLIAGLDENPFIGFAPVFSDADAGRVLTTRSETNTDMIEETYRSDSITSSWFAPLPYSEYELHTIIELFENHDKTASGYLHTEATKESFFEQAPDAGIIHIASHGFFNEEKPDLSGIVFTIDNEKTLDDAILFAGEIYSTELNAELVVLSSCESGIGEYVRGEGLMAMTRGFLYSGVDNIIVSLWKVYDRHTNKLMHEFYDALLTGASYSSALRQAKLTMIENENSAFPHFWGGFVLIGN